MTQLDDKLNEWLDFKGADITFGIHEGEGTREHPDAKGKTVAEIGTIHEYGEGEMPERSFIRGYLEQKQPEIIAKTDRALASMVEGRRTPRQAFDALALALEGGMKARFSEGIGPELAESTKQRKGSSLQLVDTGVLRASITGEFRLKDSR